MRIEQSHTLTIEEVKKRTDGLADSLVGLPIPGGVSVSDIVKRWNGDELEFSFRISKGFLGAPIKGRLSVTATHAALDLDVPPILFNFINEEMIHNVLQQKMAETLA
jgi:hypothetical protein